MAAKTKVENKEEVLENDNLQDEVGASDKKDKNKKEKKNKDKKKKGGILPLLLFAVILGALVSVLFFNAGNIREKYLRNTLEKIPVVKNILPEKEETDEYAGLSKEALASQARVLDAENKALEEEKTALNDQIKNLNQEMARLREIEANQNAFKAEKESFDRMIAENDPTAYSSYYESIEPDTAKEIYKEITENAQTDKEKKQYTQTFENMKKDAAAKVLEEMMGTDMDLVVQILNNISSEQRANILGAMDPANAASCARQMAP